MKRDEASRQHVLLTILGGLMIAVGAIMLSNLWACEDRFERVPPAFEEVLIAGSSIYSPGQACRVRSRMRCGSGACARVHAPEDGFGIQADHQAAYLSAEAAGLLAKRLCRRVCRR